MLITLIICAVVIFAMTVITRIMTAPHHGVAKSIADYALALIVSVAPVILILKVATLWAFIVAGALALIAIIFVIAFGKRLVQNPKDALVFIATGLALATMLTFSAVQIAHAAELPDEDVETPAVVTDNLEEYASSFTDEQLLKMFGEPKPFKPSSTLEYLNERQAATGFYDAVTYNFYNDGKDNWLGDEMLSNPIFLMGADAALREAKLVGDSDWAKTFAKNDDYNHWIEKVGDTWYVTREYHLIACRYCMIMSGAEYLDQKSDYTAVKHWALNPETTKLIEKTTPDKYDFFVFQFKMKDGATHILGVNVKDGRFAILEAPKAPAQEKQKEKSKEEKSTPIEYTYQLIYDANGGKNPPATDKKTTTEKSHTFTVSGDKPTRSGYTFKGWSSTAKGKVEYKAKDEIKLTFDNPTKTIYAVWSYNGGGGGHGGGGGGGGGGTTYTKTEEQIPDNQGKAPIGGTGTDGVDDQGPGKLRKNEPIHVDKDKDKSNDTREEVKIPVDDKTTVDENKPDNKPIEIRHDTDYTDDKGKTHDIDDDPVNSGEVSGF